MTLIDWFLWAGLATVLAHQYGLNPKFCRALLSAIVLLTFLLGVLGLLHVRRFD